MLRKLCSNLTYANVMATIAVFLAIGGGAVAVSAVKKNSVGTKQLKGGAVKTSKLANGAVTEPKIGGNAVTSAKLKDGSVGLADSANSLHQKCPAGTVYVIGTCLDTANQGLPGGVNYIDAEQSCQARGARLAAAAELSSMVAGGLGTIPTPEFSWALEVVGGPDAMVVTNIGAIGVGNGTTDLRAFRCSFTPLD